MSAPEKGSSWWVPALALIEKRSVNKELQAKRVLVNFILLLVFKLVENFTRLILFKLDWKLIDFDSSSVWYIRLFLNLLFVYNTISGIYHVLKPSDKFTDLDLSNERRQLLGLPILQEQNQLHQSKKDTIKHESIKLNKLEPTIYSNNPNISLSPKKSQVLNPPIASTFSNKSSGPKVGPIKRSTTPTKSKTPIASPMSSPSPIKPYFNSNTTTSPSRRSTISTLSKSSGAGPSLRTTLLNSKKSTSSLAPPAPAGVFTPTYIPSPKYYYRMDSPTKTRRI